MMKKKMAKEKKRAALAVILAVLMLATFPWMGNVSFAEEDPPEEPPATVEEQVAVPSEEEAEAAEPEETTEEEPAAEEKQVQQDVAPQEPASEISEEEPAEEAIEEIDMQEEQPREKTIDVPVYKKSDKKDLLPDVMLKAEGVMSDGVTAYAYEAEKTSVENYAAERALYICFEKDGEEYLPEEKILITEKDKNASLDDAFIVFKEDKDNNKKEIKQDETVIKKQDGEISFAYEKSGIYAIAKDERVLKAEGKDYEITVTYGKDKKLPLNGTALSVKEIKKGDKGYDSYVKKSAKAAGDEDAIVKRLFDISITDEKTGKEYEPDGSVNVSIKLPEENLEKADASVIHFEEGAIKDKPVDVKAALDKDTAEFTTDSFSVYAVVVAPPPVSRHDDSDTITSVDQLGVDESEIYHLSIARSGGTYFTSEVKTSGKNITIKPTTASTSAGEYHFEVAEGEANNRFYVYTEDGGTKRYIARANSGDVRNITLSATDKLAFFVTYENGGLVLQADTEEEYYLQYSGSGGGFRLYTDKKNKENSVITAQYITETVVEDDPYDFDGKSYGIFNYGSGTTAQAMMARTANGGLAASSAIARKNPTNLAELLYMTEDGQPVSEWTFSVVLEDTYTISTQVSGQTKYLKREGGTVVLSDTPYTFQIAPGTGQHAGKVRFIDDEYAVTFEGNHFGAAPISEAGKEWLDLTELSDLQEDDFVIYSASKVSVSDQNVTNGSKIIVYTRKWNPTTKRYEFYAVDHDGSLVRCYETGDSIQWVGTRINTMTWNLVEYYWEGTNDPNYYYELYNPYSKKYMAPQITGDQTLSDNVIGINLNGRRYGDYYTTILAWDDPNYAYAGLHVEDDHISSCPISEADDFYFAILQETEEGDDSLTEVPTLDHTQYGISMKMIDFDGNSGQNDFLNSYGYTDLKKPTQGLLSTNLGTDGFPTNANGVSMSSLYAGEEDVNHIFIASTYSGTGYYEFDSTQNYAALQSDKNFNVYKQLGTHDSSLKNTLQHGQFFPYNDLEENVLASVNKRNMYNALGNPLEDTDPRKYEPLYLIRHPDYYFGVDLSASFVQTPNGHDAWGHDIVYEFTGDDDFWLYVDGELVIDLGGIHSALPGSVNFCTGEVSVNGKKTTLKALFEQNYQKRGMTQSQIDAKINQIFDRNEKGQYVFKDYTTHTMRIFFMERGAGASNLHMRFNLSSVKPGQILLNKEISGTEDNDYKLAEYGYQIWYETEDGDGVKTWNILSEDTQTGSRINVTYQNTNVPAKYKKHYTPAGSNITYDDVWFLTPNQTVAISVPDDTINYKIKEVGVNSQVYDTVTVNGETVTGVQNAGTRYDYETSEALVSARQRVVFNNHVKEDAKRTLTITKRLYDAAGNEITNDPAPFNFRLYLANENDTQFSPAELQAYCVIDKNGEYCKWDYDGQKFVGIGVTDHDLLTPAQEQQVTFHTSLNGAISKIPAGYKVEVRDLLVGTQFKVEERANEIPKGYSFIEYQRDGSSYITHGEEVNEGTIRENESPAVEVHNKRGFGLTVNKAWSDQSFMDSHGDVFIGVYVDGQLLPDSVKRLHGVLSAYYYWDSLVPGKTFSDYEVREVKLTGNDYVVSLLSGNVTLNSTTVTPCEEGDTVTVNAKAKTDTEEKPYDYKVSYAVGEITGSADGIRNVRTDTITNSRHGIKLVKEDMNGNELSGAIFTLKDEEGDPIGAGTYTSDVSGLITIAYINVDTVYVLEETKSPNGYCAIEEPVKFKIDSETGNVVIVDADNATCTMTQAQGDNMAQITVKNRPCSLEIVKKGKTADGEVNPLAGAHFALYDEVSDGSQTTIDNKPRTGYEDLVSQEQTGILSGMGNALPRGSYYLKEKSAPVEFIPLQDPVRFTLDQRGKVTVDENENASVSSVIQPDGSVKHTITVVNGQTQPVPSGYKDNKTAYLLAIAICVLLVAMFVIVRRKEA